MALREIDKYYFNQRIFSAVVAVEGEEGNMDVFGGVRHMARKLLCSAHLCPNWRLWRGKGGYTRSALKNVPSQHRAHQLEQQDMRTMLRVICWELECASRTHGGRQRLFGLNNLAWKGQMGSQGRTDTRTNEGSQAKHATDLNRPFRRARRREAGGAARRGVGSDADGRRRRSVGRLGHG